MCDPLGTWVLCTQPASHMCAHLLPACYCNFSCMRYCACGPCNPQSGPFRCSHYLYKTLRTSALMAITKYTTALTDYSGAACLHAHTQHESKHGQSAGSTALI